MEKPVSCNRDRAFNSAKFSTVWICFSKVSLLVDTVRMSSACANAPENSPEMFGPSEFPCSSLRSGSMMSKNRVGDNTDPCRTPLQYEWMKELELIVSSLGLGVP